MSDQLKALAEPPNYEIREKWVDMNDGSFALQVVATTAPGSGQAADREFAFTDYKVKTAFAGAAVGDFVRSTSVYDLTGTSPVQIGQTMWQNLSQGTALAGTPSIANLEPLGASGLTNAQFVAGLNGLAASLGTVGQTTNLFNNSDGSVAVSPAVQVKLPLRTIQLFGKTTSGAGQVIVDIMVSNVNDITTAVKLADLTIAASTVMAADAVVVESPWLYMWASRRTSTGAGISFSVVVGV